jgi:hypothetical protein
MKTTILCLLLVLSKVSFCQPDSAEFNKILKSYEDDWIKEKKAQQGENGSDKRYVTPPVEMPMRTFRTEDAVEFMNSPCWKEIGYNPEMPKSILRDEYRYCEEQKIKQKLKIVALWIGVLGLLIVGYLIVRKALKSNINNWEKLKQKYDTDENFKVAIDKFLIPDKISLKVFVKNQTNQEDSSYSYNKYIKNTDPSTFNFPLWFLFGYPDVSVWYGKNKEEILKRMNLTQESEISSDLRQLRQLVNDFISRFKKLELSS